MSVDKVKEAFKYYKRKVPSPSFENIIDIYNTDNQDVQEFNLISPETTVPDGLISVNQWKAFQHKHYSGLVLIRNPFKTGYQRYWAYRCLCDYPLKPSRTNLDPHVELTKEDNIWEISHNKKLNESKEKTLLQRLRWTTLGFHHNWDTKIYGENDKTPFPDDLTLLSKYIAASLGCDSYNAEAAIINYYNLSSTLGGHTDHSEFDHEAPLISVSLGQTAIFLVGGVTREEEPVAMFLRSGDIVVMMGPSRLAYHAIPRILSRDQELVRKCFEVEKTKDGDQGQTENYFENEKEWKETEICDEAVVSTDSRDISVATNMQDKPIVKHSCCKEMLESENVGKSESDNLAGACVKQRNMKLSNIDEVNKHIRKTMTNLTDDIWEPFSEYLNTNRINMNIRQVLRPGEVFPQNETHGDNNEASKRQKLS